MNILCSPFLFPDLAAELPAYRIMDFVFAGCSRHCVPL